VSLRSDARLAARFAARELRGGLSGFRILLACLALGVAAIAGVGSVRSAIEAGLAEEGAALLGGDAEVSFTYRFATGEERDWMDRTAVEVSEIADFRSMAVVERDGAAERALVQIKAVDDAYPLVGTVGLSDGASLAEAFECAPGPCLVAEGLLVDRLGLSVGERLKLGATEFTLAAVLEREPDSATAGFGFGPRVIVRRADLATSGLLEPGTLFDSHYRMILPEGLLLDTAKGEARRQFGNSGLRWRDARNGAPGVQSFVERLASFLVLVGLSGLAVGGVGVSAAVRAYLARKTSVIATLRTLGATRRVIFLTYFLQIGALAALGIVIGLVLGAVVPLALAPVIADQLPVPARFGIFPGTLAEAALYGVLSALIFTLWPLARTSEIRAATLFRDALSAGRALPGWRYLGVILGLAVVLVAVAAAFRGPGS
jgi:putative ABC transport system permease protein